MKMDELTATAISEKIKKQYKKWKKLSDVTDNYDIDDDIWELLYADELKAYDVLVKTLMVTFNLSEQQAKWMTRSNKFDEIMVRAIREEI